MIQAVQLCGGDVGTVKLLGLFRHGGGVVVVQSEEIFPCAHLAELRIFPRGHVQPDTIDFLLLGKQLLVEQRALADSAVGLGDNLRDGVLTAGGRLGEGFAVDCIDDGDHLLSGHEKSTPRTRFGVLVCFLFNVICCMNLKRLILFFEF